MKKRLSVLCFVLIFATVFSSFFALTASAVTVVDLKEPTITGITATSAGVTIKWENHSENPRCRFIIYKSRTAEPGSWQRSVLADEDARKHTDKYVSVGDVYYYTIKAYIYEYNSETKTKTEHISPLGEIYKVSIDALARPVFKLVGNGGKGVVLKWEAEEAADGVMIYRSRTGQKGSWTKIKTTKDGNKGTYTDTKVNIGETYYYCYKTYTTINGKKYYSQSSKAYKSTILDVSVPENFKVTATDSGVELEYSKSLGTIGYVIYRSDTGKKGTWSRIKVTTSNNTLRYVDKTAKKGATYYYTVKSYKTVNGVTTYSKQAQSEKVVNSTSVPAIQVVGNNKITFNGYYDVIDVRVALNHFDYDDEIKIYIDGVEVTEELANDTEFLDKLDYFFYIDEDKISDDELVLSFVRLSSGGGNVRIEYASNKKIYDQITVVCPELEFDKDADKLYGKFYEGQTIVDEAKSVLNTLYYKDLGVEEEKSKANEVLGMLREAEKLFEDSHELLMKYEDVYKDNEIYQEDLFVINTYLRHTSSAIDYLDNNNADTFDWDIQEAYYSLIYITDEIS